MIVVWSETAIEAALRIKRQLAELSATAADELAQRLDIRAGQLELFPFSGRTLPEFGLPLLRELIEGPYRIIYEVFPDRVEILTIRSGYEDLRPSS